MTQILDLLLIKKIYLRSNLMGSFIFSTLFASCLSDNNVLCYFAKSSEERIYPYRLYPQGIDATLCTHILYSFSVPDLTQETLPKNFLRFLSNEGGPHEFTTLRRKNPNLTLMLSIGGWREGSTRFSKIASSPVATDWFARQVCEYTRTIGFDGIDINWQWPGLREGGSADDRENFSLLIKAIKDQINKDAAKYREKRLLLSVVLPPFKEIASKGFEVDTILREVDYLIMYTMDYYTSTEPTVNHHAPLYSLNNRHCKKEFSVDVTVQHYLGLGIPADKIILGIPLYGHSYILEDVEDTTIGANADDEGKEGFATLNRGSLSYFEICKYIQDNNWSVHRPNTTALGPYAYLSHDWVAYDDADIIKRKVYYANEKCLGGIMLWTIDMDDFRGICDEKFPLLNAAKTALQESINKTCKKAPVVSNGGSSKPFKIIKREKWQAQQPTEEIPNWRVFPAPYVIIGHTTSQPCANFDECKNIVRNIQSYHISIDYGDIGYSFLVGGDGNVYEGLGWNRHGAHTLPFNARSLGIAFIGNFATVEPPQKQIDAALKLIAEGVRLGQLASDYKIFGQRQVVALDSPGNKLMSIIKNWPHWAEYDPTEDDED